MKDKNLFENLDDIDAGTQDFKLSLANLVSYSNVSTKKIDFLKKLSTALVKKRNNEKKEDDTLNNIGVKYDRLNNECKILFYKTKNYKELCEVFYSDKKNIGKKKLFDDIVPEFLAFANNKIEDTQQFKSLEKFDKDASELEIIKLPNTIVTYANTYKKDVQATINAFKSLQDSKKIKIFINEFKSLLQDEIKEFLQKIKIIEGRTGEDPPEETKESTELISDETFKYFLDKAAPFVKKMYEDKPFFSFNASGEFEQQKFNDSPFRDGYENLNIGSNVPPPLRISVNEPKEMANLTNSILKNNLSKKNLIFITTKQAERSDYPRYTPEKKQELAGKIKNDRIEQLLKILEDLVQIKTDQEAASASGREINFSRFLQVTQKLYLQFTTKKNNYPLFYIPDTEDLEGDIKLTSPYNDNVEYTDDLKRKFNEIKDILIVLGQEERIIKNRFKDKNEDELKKILKDMITLKRLRNMEIYRDITYIYEKNTLRTAYKRTRPDAFKIRKIIENMQEWSETQNLENNSYEQVYLKGYADVIKLLKNKNQVTQNPSQPEDLEEKIKRIIKPFIKEKFIRKQNGKKNLRN